MPTYKVTDPTTGKVLRLTGDSPPTEGELEDIFSKVQPRPIMVRLPNGQTARYPAGMPPQEIEKAIVESRIKWDEPIDPSKITWDQPGKSFGQKVAGAVAPYAPIAGAVAGGAIAAPINLLAPGVAEATGVGLGYLAGKEGQKRLQEYAQGTPRPSTTQAFLEAGRNVPEAAEMGLGGPIAGKAISGGLSAAGKVIKPVWGRLTGAGTGAIEESLASGAKGTSLNPLKTQTAYDKALRGELTGEEIVDNAKAALQTIKDNRSVAYQNKLSEIAQNTQEIDIEPIRRKAMDLMRQYNVTTNAKGEFDFSRVAMGKAGRSDIADTLDEVLDWGSKSGDKTAVGLDALKRRLDDFYSDSSQARQFVAALRSEVKNTITQAVPEYAQMTKGYAEATKLIKDIESGLMLRKQGMSGRIVADQTLRRLTSSMRDNFQLRRELVEALGSEGAQDISGQVAGYAMRSWVPLGLAGTGPALVGEATLAHYVSPSFWPVLAASSPRVAGEFLRVLGGVWPNSRE